MNRAKRTTVDLSVGAMAIDSIRKGGRLAGGAASIFEYLLPERGERLDFFVDTSAMTADVAISARIIPLSTYPTACAADADLDVAMTSELLGSHGSGGGSVILPDACSRVAVIIYNPQFPSTVPVDTQIWVASSPVTDAFDRTESQGWGESIHNQHWEAASPQVGSVGGSIDGHTASLSVTTVLATASLGAFSNSIQSTTLIAHFTNCAPGSAEAFVADSGMPAFITNAGLVFSLGASVQLTEFDACAPWYLRVVDDGSETDVTVWQATVPEPDSPTLSVASIISSDRVTLKAVGLSGLSPGDAIRVDLIEVKPFPST
jgi:hypothetical protein